MTRNVFVVAALGLISTAALAVGGCASNGSNGSPNALKGDDSTQSDGRDYSRQVEQNRKAAKGQYVAPRLRMPGNGGQ
jgi:hypothetical protein